MSSDISRVWGRMSRRQVLRGGALAGAGLAGAALIGCGGGSKPAATATGGATQAAGGAAQDKPGIPVVKAAPKDGGTYTEPVSLTSPQQDMHTALAQSIWHNLSERAMLPDPNTNEARPGLIEKWEIPDNTHFILRVRQGVKIHNKAPWNGREFSAEDLAFNIDRIAGNTAAAEGLQKSAFQRANTFEGMSKIEVVDKSTVRITMASPSSAWLKGFLEWRNVMMPKGIVEVGFKDPMAFASYGSFMMSEFVPNVREVFVKNPNYYRQGQPHLDKIVHTVVPDNAAAVAGFISKQFSILPSVTEQDIKTVKAARPDALYYQTPGSQWLYIWPSAKYGAFQDARVRKAMQLAIDYQEMGEGFYGPGWEYTGLLFSGYQEAWKPDKIKTLPGYNPATKAKDREDANKLMAAAGHPNGQGVDFEIITPTGTGVFAAHNDDALRFQSQMQKAFPQMKPVMKPIPDRAQFANVQASRNFHVQSYSSVSQPDVVSEARSLYHSKGGRNYGNFAEPEADALLDKALVEMDPKARAEIMNTFQQKAFDTWMPIFALYVEPKKAILQPNLGGYDKMVGPWSQGLQYHTQGEFFLA